MSDNSTPQPGGWMIIDANGNDAGNDAGNDVGNAPAVAWRPDLNFSRSGTYQHLHLYRDAVRCSATARTASVNMFRIVRANMDAIYDLVPTYQSRLQWIHDGFAVVLALELPFAEWAFLSDGIERLITAAQHGADLTCVPCTALQNAHAPLSLLVWDL
jgi:hypothetical protein